MKKEHLKGGISAMFGEVSTPQPDPREITSEEYQEMSERQSKRRYYLTGRRRKDNDRELVTKDDVRTSLLLDKNQYEVVREIALREGMTIKDLVYSMFQLAIDKYEKKHGKVELNKKQPGKKLLF